MKLAEVILPNRQPERRKIWQWYQPTAIQRSGSEQALSYDAQGNRTVLSDESGAWHYNDKQQLVKRGSGPNEVTYRWGVTGELLEETRPQATTTYQYNAANQLVTVSRNNHILAEYHYDAFGRRIGKWVGGVQQWFVYSPEGLLAQLDSHGQMQQAWGWEPGTLYGSKPLWQADLGPKATLNTAKIAWLHTDNTGTPLIALDDQGNRIWQGTRDPLAAIIPSADSKITVNLRYAGQYADAETGLYYNGSRYYDPLTGRYLQPDPLGLGGGLNSYAYALNNPLSYIDPEGQIPILALAGPIARTIGSLAIGMAVDHLISYLPDNECDPWLSPRNWAEAISYISRGGRPHVGPRAVNAAGKKTATQTAQKWSVDPTTQVADKKAGILVDGVYKNNPTAQNLTDLLTNTGRVGSKNMNGKFMYVVDQKGNVIIGTRGKNPVTGIPLKMPHPTLIGGKDPQVLGAGMIDIRAGKIYSIDNASGHFKPGAGSLDAAQQAFGKLSDKYFNKDFQGYMPYQK